ncbi:hypothetical protein ACTFIU_004633 [Dictyostelium citrinum]
MRIIASILLVLSIASIVLGQGSPSQCTNSNNGINYGALSNGSYSALSAASGSNPQGKYRYYWNICGAATQCKADGVAACQLQVGSTGNPTSVGVVSLASWKTVGGLPSIQYSTNSKCSNGNMRTMVVSLQCNQNANSIQATLVNEDKCIYSTTMSGKGLCGGGNSGSGSGDNNGSSQPKKGGIGGGWIFIIILLSVTVVYIVGGIIFNAKVKHQHGSDMFPNKEMWVNFGGLIKDGIFFIKHKVSGSGGQGYQQV